MVWQYRDGESPHGAVAGHGGLHNVPWPMCCSMGSGGGAHIAWHAAYMTCLMCCSRCVAEMPMAPQPLRNWVALSQMMNKVNGKNN